MSLFEYNIEAKPDFSLLNVKLPKGEKLKVEASAMAAMDTNLVMKTRLKGGFSRFLTGESIFISEYQAQGVDGEISIAPGPAGDISHYEIKPGESFYLTSTSFLASAQSVEIESKFQGFAKGFFSGEGLFVMRCSGEGDLWFNSYGALIEVDITDEYVIDTGHIVAFTEGLDYSIGRVGGYKSLFFSGEGFVARFKGQGKAWIQTKLPFGLVSWADQFRIVERSSSN